jgi:hypothetical protein
MHQPKREWSVLTLGNRRVASDRQIEVDWTKHSLDDNVFTHCSIVCSVQTTDNGYYIEPPCDELVNSNGNAWSTPVLLATFRSFIGAQNYYEHCFPAGTRVLMVDGTYKNIEDVRAGEMVVNRLGKPAKVANVQIRQAQKLKRIHSSEILCKDLFVTANHPLYVFHARETCPKTGRPNVPPSRKDNPNPERTGFAVGVHHALGEDSAGLGWVAEWREAGCLDELRDVMTHPMLSVEQDCPIDINDARAELIGWFLAEGSFTCTNASFDGESGIAFSLSANEEAVAERLQTLLLQEFGDELRSDCKLRVREYEYHGKPSYLRLTLSNIKVANFFKKWCNKYSWGKRLHSDFMSLPKRLQAITLRAYLAGDGTGKIESRGYVVSTVSKQLAQQLLTISWRLGLAPNYSEDNLLPRYSVQGQGEDGSVIFVDPKTGKRRRPECKLCYSVCDSKALLSLVGESDCILNGRVSKKRARVFESQDGSWIGFRGKLFDVDLPEAIDVYNMEVEGDNSYVAEGVVVHNCQVPELSKGTILDAVIRPVKYTSETGKSSDIYYVDILVATERKHTELVTRIESGEIDTLSMGCLAHWVQCSKCGKEIDDSGDNCEHLDREMLQYFTDENGVRRIVAELCGRSYINNNGERVGDPNSVEFIEASWVEKPAFKGAVINHFISELPKKAAIMQVSTRQLEAAVEDVFKLRVADQTGMMVLRLAREELIRRQRKAKLMRIVDRIAPVV